MNIFDKFERFYESNNFLSTRFRKKFSYKPLKSFLVIKSLKIDNLDE